MSISARQLLRAVREGALEILREGRVPSLNRIAQAAGKRLPKTQAAPTLRPRHQGWREQWNLGGMNGFLAELDFDLRIMYESILELGAQILRRYHQVEATSRSQHAAIDRLESEALNLLFVLQDGDGHFAAVYDDFSDLSKVDLVRSTPDIVDLQSHTAELPKNTASARRVDLSHMADRQNWPIDVQANGKVVQSQTASDAPFGHLFTDVLSMWRYDVLVDQPGPVSVSFVFPVSRLADGEISISRVQVVPLAEHEQAMEVLYSVDGVNFLQFPNSTGLLDLDKSSRVVNLDFPLTRVQYLKVTLFRETYDRIVDGLYLSSFGLLGLGLYMLGRGFASELVSLEHVIPETRDRIEKISLSVLEEIPPQTRIDYFVGPVLEPPDDMPPELEEGDWIPITPVGRAPRADEPGRVVRLSTDSQTQVSLVPETPLTPFETYRAINFYQINSATDRYAERLITDDVVWGTAFLHRGNRAWKRTKPTDLSYRDVSSNHISFSTGHRQKLYAVATEVVSFGDAEIYRDKSRAKIQVSRPIDYRPDAGHQLVPRAGVDPFNDTAPLYALYEVALDEDQDESSETMSAMTLTNPYVFTAEPIDVEKSEQTEELLLAFRPSEVRQGVANSGIDTALISEVMTRAGLAQWRFKIVAKILSMPTDDDIAAGKVTSKVRVTHGVSGYYNDMECTVVESTAVPAKRTSLAGLSDEQILELFGRITIRTPFVSGVRAEKDGDPSVVYKNGVDFSLETRIVNGIERLYARRTPNSSIASGSSVTFYLRYRRDLTRNVFAIDGDTVYLDRAFSFPPGVKAKVSYRWVPSSSNEVLKGSLRVSQDLAGEDLYSQGTDYHFDPKTTSLVRIPGGRIPASGAVYASYRYKAPTTVLETFSTWVFVDRKEGVRVEYESLGIDYEHGERLLVSTGFAQVDVSTSTRFPELSHGWHEVVVVSRNPDLHTDAAIFKVAEARDLQDQAVFIAGGEYFSEIRGSRTPLARVPYEYLKASVLPHDHTRFAIDEDGRVIVNFQPNSQAEFFTYGYRSVMNGGVPVETLDHYNEEFEVEYRYRRADARRVTGILLRAVLTREKGSSGTESPLLFGYAVRVG